MISAKCQSLLVAALCAFLLSGCGGEEDDVTLPVLTFQKQSVAFSVTAPDDPTPRRKRSPVRSTSMRSTSARSLKAQQSIT